MRSLSLLVLLLFAVVVCTAATLEQMKELFGNGAPQRFKSCHGLYLTDERPTRTGEIYYDYSQNLWAVPRQEWGPLQDWTFERINDHQIAIKSNRGNYVSHGNSGWAKQVEGADEREILTPVKNGDGSWSFKSYEDRWLSAKDGISDDPNRRFINFKPSENKECEHWVLEPYTPPKTPPLMAELLTDGGRRRFKAFNELYLTYEENTILRNEVTVTPRTGDGMQLWTIEQINEKEVAIRGPNGRYVSHSTSDVGRPQSEANEWEMLTPVKNPSGSWSFKSRWDMWLSGGGYREGDVHFMPENKKCERWTLEPWYH